LIILQVGKYNNPKYSKLVELLRKIPDVGKSFGRIASIENVQGLWCFSATFNNI
jgi:hypothetical protein